MLDSLRVLDLSWVLGGPFAGQLLAQLGAEVIKVEPIEGDMARTIPPYEVEGDSSFFLSVNRGKRSVALDLKHPDGLQALRDLVKESHAVIYGFAPDVPRRLGIDHQALLAVNPRICVGELIGLHDADPYKKAPAFDLIVQAMGGIMSVTGQPGGPPTRVGYQIADLAGGLYLALGTVGALLQAALTGKGRYVQVSLLDCQLALLTWQAQNYLVSGDIPGPRGSRHAMIAPSEAFECADGAHIAISPTGDAFWRQFCTAIDHAELSDDERFKTATARLKNIDELSKVLAGIFSTRSSDEWSETLFDQRIPAGKVHDVAQALAQPLAMLRSMVEVVPHPGTGENVSFIGNPFKYGGAKSLCYPPARGADTDAVLKEICGYSDEKILDLRHNEAIGPPAGGS